MNPFECFVEVVILVSVVKHRSIILQESQLMLAELPEFTGRTITGNGKSFVVPYKNN